MKVAITGGHFSPALSVIEVLRKRQDTVVVLGRKYVFEGEDAVSLEYKICQKNNIPFYEIKAARLQRKITQHTLPALLRFPRGIFDAIKVLRKEKPDVILSFGGYIALPVALAAFMQQIPVVIHEQTQEAGLANKIIGKFADKILLSFPSSKKHFPKGKIVVTGNPLRKEVFTVEKKQDLVPGKKLIYVTGGSAGSHFINSLIKKTAPTLLEKYAIIHQTGDSQLFKDYDLLYQMKESLPSDLAKRYILQKFILPDEIGWILKHADLVIARSGANTVLELIALEKRSLLIPLPHGQSGEQLKNAQLMKKIGLAEVLEQEQATGKQFLETVEKMMHNQKGYKIEEQVKKNYFFPHAAEAIVEQLEKTNETKKKKTTDYHS